MARGGFFAIDSLAGVHILVVDEDAAFRQVLVALLRYCGALVIDVPTEVEALAAMDQVKPDVLVITIGGNGRSTATFPKRVRMRKPENGGHVPIVAILRHGAEPTLPEGIAAHLQEPLNPWELCRVISTLLATD